METRESLAALATTAQPPKEGSRRRRRLRARDIQLYRLCEDLTSVLIYFMVIFSPWAFGTTQVWSMWVMNVVGYATGFLLAIKLVIRRLKGYQPARWDTEIPDRRAFFFQIKLLRPAQLTGLLAVLTVAVLGYCLVSALNARSTYVRDQFSFEYHQFISWLPHSFDSARSWFYFWNYLSLACGFWALCDWLLGKSHREERAEHLKTLPPDKKSAPLLPARMRTLLWVLCVNGGLLAVESIVQRLDNSGRLLWLIQPKVNPGAEAQFGPFAYRGNASQYFNLLWPVCLGFWWMLHRSGGFKRKGHHVLLVCGALMAACPFISTSRGGALVAASIMLLAGPLLFASQLWRAARHPEGRRTPMLTSVVLLFFFASAAGLGIYLGWQRLKPRMEQIDVDFQGREKMYELAWPMAQDYPVYGTGPGTFEPLFQFYRPTLDTYWPAQLHNDYLETLITFGAVGCALIALALGTVLVRWFTPGGIHGGRRFVILLWLALGGCLVHARWDFPFQIYSIVFLFLALCAFLFNLSRHPEGRSLARTA